MMTLAEQAKAHKQAKDAFLATCHATFGDCAVGDEVIFWHGTEPVRAQKIAPELVGRWGSQYAANAVCCGKHIVIVDSTPCKINQLLTAVAIEFAEQLEAERAELADYDATMDAACGRYGY